MIINHPQSISIVNAAMEQNQLITMAAFPATVQSPAPIFQSILSFS